MARLLVSVRDVREAESALAGGADLIDVKEPSNGPLGRAEPPFIESIIRFVAGRAPTSCACGELNANSLPLPDGLAFAKFGLAGWRDRDWIGDLLAIRLPQGCGRVAVAYADWESCNAPPPEEVVAAASEHQFAAFLIDTHRKNGSTLLDALPIETIADLTQRCQSAGVPVALAGSLGIAEIERLSEIAPDWFAVRGAACLDGRESRICPNRVRDMKCAVAIPGSRRL